MDVLTVQDLKKKQSQSQLGKKNAFVLLDVREASERDIAVIPGDIHIPLGDMTTRYAELNQDQEIIVYCRSGARSAQVCQFLTGMGYENVKNLKGGVLSWSKEIDSSVKQY